MLTYTLFKLKEIGDATPQLIIVSKLPMKFWRWKILELPGNKKRRELATGSTRTKILFSTAEISRRKKPTSSKKPILPREVVHENTRFKKDPFLKPIAPDKLQSVVNARVRSSIREQGKVGIDGKPITPARTPYGLLGTPSPMPGQDESPFMTWGQLEATPQRAMTPGGASVGGGQTTTNPTISNAPAFYLGDVNDRED